MRRVLNKNLIKLSIPFILVLVVIAGLSACSTIRQPMTVAENQAPILLEDRAIMADGFELPLEFWRPDAEIRVVVLALHGFNDYHRAFSNLGSYLAKHSIATYAYDQRGFGATKGRGYWAGTERMARDAQTMVGLLREKHPLLPVYLLGESMGGAVGITAITEPGAPEVDGVVLVAPAVWARKTMPFYQRWALSIARRIAPGWKPTGKSLNRKPSDNIEMLRALGRDPLVIKTTRIDTVAGLATLMDAALASSPRLGIPTLVLYGERDEIVPKLPTCHMLNSLPKSGKGPRSVALYPRGYHMLTRDLQSQVVLEDIAGWILNQDAPLPSGHQADQSLWQEKLCHA